LVGGRKEKCTSQSIIRKQPRSPWRRLWVPDRGDGQKRGAGLHEREWKQFVPGPSKKQRECFLPGVALGYT
jgi:hypothetical protein